ncbi:hypothetical protein Lalb_Chr16g0389001 [Lupinus albus]|uniref:Uncharacterized protein n=1 Tax=Lupinus albus TaxID=3870 RepID=A0A6A4NVK4_LUPAL|nr:hypothetical protein Lalb_Chr16g0389001 [Lupinus albus]
MITAVALSFLRLSSSHPRFFSFIFSFFSLTKDSIISSHFFLKLKLWEIINQNQTSSLMILICITLEILSFCIQETIQVQFLFLHL